MKPSARPSAGQTALRFSKLKEKGTTVEPPTKKVRKIRCTTWCGRGARVPAPPMPIGFADEKRSKREDQELYPR